MRDVSLLESQQAKEDWLCTRWDNLLDEASLLQWNQTVHWLCLAKIRGTVPKGGPPKGSQRICESRDFKTLAEASGPSSPLLSSVWSPSPFALTEVQVHIPGYYYLAVADLPRWRLIRRWRSKQLRRKRYYPLTSNPKTYHSIQAILPHHSSLLI